MSRLLVTGLWINCSQTMSLYARFFITRSLALSDFRPRFRDADSLR
jgi:hypothetical protein